MSVPESPRTIHGAVANQDVAAVQTELLRLGFRAGDIDGIYGFNTAAAVSEFQKQNRLGVDGIVGPQTWAALQQQPDSAIPRGELKETLVGAIAGIDVSRLQETLTSEGFDPGDIDGVYGPDTAAAVRAYQTAHGLTPDGIVGPDTWATLIETLQTQTASEIADSVATVASLNAKMIDGLPTLILVSDSTELARVDARDGSPLGPKLRTGLTTPIQDLGVTAGHQHVTVVVTDDSMETWDLRTGEPISAPVTIKKPGSLITVAMTDDSLYVAFGDEENAGRILSWPAFRDDTSKPDPVSIEEKRLDGWSHTVVFASDGLSMAAGLNRTTTPHRIERVTLDNYETLSPETTQTGADADLTGLTVGGTLTKPILVTRSQSGLIERWNGLTGQQLSGVVDVDGNETTHFSASEGLVVTAADNGPLRAFDIANGEMIQGEIAVELDGATIVSVTGIGSPERGAMAALDSSGRVHSSYWGEFRAEGAAFQPTPKVARDYWTVQDTLGYTKYAQAMAAFIQQEDTEPPLTLGVKGPWGTGKSSVMRMVQERLDPPLHRSEADWEFPELTLTDDGLAALGVDKAIRSWRRSKSANGGHRRTSIGDSGITVSEVLNRADELAPDEPDLSVGHTVEPGSPEATDSTRPDPPTSDKWRPTVWFNPWMYQTGEEVWAGLAHELISQTVDRLPPRQREMFWLRLNLRRIDRNRLRQRVYKMAFARALPALLVMGVSLLLFLVPPAAEAAGQSLGGWWTLWIPIVGFAGSAGRAVQQFTRIFGAGAAKSLPDVVQGPISAASEGTQEDLASLADVFQDPDYATQAGFLYLLQNDIHRVLDLIATSDRPLVVFVDDLDRCSPGVVAQTIEAINLFLAGQFPNCIFVLAVEPGVVAAHVEAQHEDLVNYLKSSDLGGDWTGLGWRFLEKIVQLPLTLPRPEEPQAERYLNALFDQTPHPDQPSEGDQESTEASPTLVPSTDAVSQAEDLFQATNLNEVNQERAKVARMFVDQGYTQQQADSLSTEVAVRAVADLWSDSDPTVQGIIKRHALALPARNPREMKRFINLFRFYNFVAAPQWVQVATPAEREAVFEQVARLATIAIRWPFFLNLLARSISEDAPPGWNRPDRPRRVLEYLEVAARNGDWDQALKYLGLAESSSQGRKDTNEQLVPLKMWSKQLNDLRAYLADPTAQRIGPFASRFL